MGCTDRVSLKQFLKEEVKPALGCTEPVAVALATARAREELEAAGDSPVSVRVTVSSNVFKNGAAVGIPGTDGLKGNAVAAALALVCGKSDWGLEVLRESSPENVKKAQKFLDGGKVTITADRKASGVYVKSEVQGSNHSSSCTIRKSHANITEVTRDGAVVFSSDASGSGLSTSGPLASGPSITAAEAIVSMTWDEVMSYLNEADDEDLAFLLKGMEMNLAIARRGFEGKVGLGVGRAIRDSFPDPDKADLGSRIKAWSAAASDARMSGVPMPVMSSAGSGNHGITAIVPVALYGQEKGMDDAKIARALLVSHLATAFVKSRTGRLSSTCGCAFAAGAGAAAGLTYLMTGSTQNAKTAVEAVVSNLIGMLCDGGKESCAFKVGTGAMEAYHAALMASDSSTIEAQGVVGQDIEETIANAAKIASGMGPIEQIILDILDERG
ncbi:MAG: serine dehydratase subunit alpha family protein [Fretibacterium sp.]|nr:serine dehydratase subunit alpha family protein [Fretibacterium sp.]